MTPDQLNRPGKSSCLDIIEHRAKLYSLCAAASGVSLLSLAQPAKGEVVITNTNIPIPRCGVDACPTSISLNNDGITDFKFYMSTTEAHFAHDSTVRVKGSNGGEAVGRSYSASCLLRGAKIGASRHFEVASDLERVAYSCSSSSPVPCDSGDGGAGVPGIGKWGGNHPNRFLGVKFLIDGATHYGWVRLTVKSDPNPLSATITEYGYETIAKKRVLAGEAGNDEANAAKEDDSVYGASLAMLALGADGLALWRAR